MRKLNNHIMKYIITLCFITSFTSTDFLFSQYSDLNHRNYAAELIQKEAKLIRQLERVSPFSLTEADQENIKKSIAGNVDFLVLDSSLNAQLLNKKSDLLKLSIPRKTTVPINLNLKKVEFISAINLASAAEQNKSLNNSSVFYWGTIEDDESSFASISIFENEIYGTIISKKGNYTLRKINNSEEYILYKEDDLIGKPDFICNAQVDVEKLIQQSQEAKKKTLAGLSNPDNCARVHLWANHSLYLEFNESSTDLSNYLTSMFSVVVLVYANEHINVTLNHITISDENGDPIVGSDTRNGDFIMFMDFAAGGGGGGAGGPICGGGGALFIGSGYNGVPTLSEGIGTLIHEMGHVFGSPHTDLCFWNGNNTQIDDCGTTDLSSPPSCFDPYNVIGPPTGFGSIMSYCGWNLDYGFGPQPGDLVRYNVYTSDCLSPCGLECNDRNANNICDVDECYPNIIDCNANIFDRAYARWACDVELAPGEFVRFNPIVPNGGSWFWTYPNGFINNNKEISVNDPGSYIFTFDDGTCTYTKTMTVAINDCLPNAIICYSGLNNQSLDQNCYVGRPAGQSVTLSPQGTSGNWSWTGPNNFSSAQREISVSTGGDYDVTLSDGTCTFEETLRVIDCVNNPLTGSIFTPQGWINSTTVTINEGESVRFSPNTNGLTYGSFLPVWGWIGPDGHYMDTQFIYAVFPGTYTVTLTVGPCRYSLDFVLNVTPDSGCNSIKSGVYYIEFADGSKRIEADANGRNFAMKDPTSNENQKWEIDFVQDGEYTVKSISSGNYMEIDNGRCHTFADTYTVDGYQGQDQREWKIIDVSGDLFFFASHCLAYTLDRGQANSMFVYDFEPTNPNTQFRLIPTTTSSGYTGSGMNCEDGDPCTRGEYYDANCNCIGGVTQADTDNNGLPDACDFSTNSPFFIESIVSGQRIWTNCADNNVSMKDPANENTQKWEVVYEGNNSYSFQNILTGQYLEVQNANCGNSSNVSTSDIASQSHQLWDIQKIDEDYLIIPKHCSSHALDRGGSDYANVHLWELDVNNINQRFQLIPSNPNSENDLSCDDGDAETIFDSYDNNCSCNGLVLSDCGNNNPNYTCQYTTNGSQYINACDITLCEGQKLIYTFSGCDANLILNLQGPNGFNAFSTDDCGSILVSDFMTPNFSGTYISRLIHKSTGCYSEKVVNITVNELGSTCDDGNECTTNDIINSNCLCEGTDQDTDNDNVCDADDICPGINDADIGLPCDDGDGCTENDVLGQDCICTGTPIGNCIDCSASIICFANIENQGWQQLCDVELTAGQSVKFGPSTDPLIFTGSWSWTGPDGYTATSREITVFTEGVYEVTFNVDGCNYTLVMNVSVECADLIVEVLNDEVTDSKRANIGIESNQIVPANADVEFHAGEYVLLQADFEVKFNGIFHAFIEGCE